MYIMIVSAKPSTLSKISRDFMHSQAVSVKLRILLGVSLWIELMGINFLMWENTCYLSSIKDHAAW